MRGVAGSADAAICTEGRSVGEESVSQAATKAPQRVAVTIAGEARMESSGEMSSKVGDEVCRAHGMQMTSNRTVLVAPAVTETVFGLVSQKPQPGARLLSLTEWTPDGTLGKVTVESIPIWRPPLPSS